MYTADSPILGRATGSPDKAIHWIAARSAHYTLDAVAEIVGGYWHYGALYGVEARLTLGQLCKETGPFGKDDFWSARPRRNGCGFGVNGRRAKSIDDLDAFPPPLRRYTLVRNKTIDFYGGDDRHWEWDEKEQRWRAGCAFVSWVPKHANDPYNLDEPNSIVAHYGRLFAYCHKDGEANEVQQAAIDYAMQIRRLDADKRGCARTWADLNGKWNGAKTSYPQDVARLANELLGAR